MIAIDTNILVRYLTRDDEAQAEAALRLLEQYTAVESSIFINNIVLCEVIWVLESAYKYPKQDIVNAMKFILQTPEFAFENHQIIAAVLYEYEKSNGADFSDILSSVTNERLGCTATYSFDEKSCKHGYFSKLGAEL